MNVHAFARSTAAAPPPVRLSGGCQGCAVAKVTLRQGIETALVRAVPEITRVVDVTDHQSGTNPYFH